MLNPQRSTFQITLISSALIAICATGCASLRKHKISNESLMACRQMSRDGVAAMEMGQWDQAHTLLADAVKKSPTDIDARRHLAEVLWSQKQHRDAVVQLEAAVRIDPRHAPTLVRSGEMLLEIGAIQRATKRVEEAISLDSTLASAWALRGRIYRHKGDSERALADLQQSLRYSPHSTEVLLEVAEIQFSLNRPQRSLTVLHHLLDVYAPGEEPQRALWLEGLVYGSIDRPHDAVESLFAASLRGPPNADLYYQLASAQKSASQPDAATSSLHQALALDSEHQASKVLLAQLQGPVSPSQGNVIRR